MMKKSITCFLITAIFLLFGNNVFAKDVSLAWEASDDPEVTGYRVYYKINSSSLPFNGSGASEGASPVDAGNNLTTTLTGLSEGEIVYFAVTAYNAFGEESEFSNVVASEWIPEVYEPANGAAVDPHQVDFTWGAAPPGSGVTYTLVYGTDPQLKTTELALQSFQGSTLFAGAAAFGLFAAAIPRRKYRAVLVLILAGGLFLLVGCGGGGGGSDSDPVAPAPISDGSGGAASAPSATVVAGISETSYSATGLRENSTYYWKVIAVDAQGQRRESETRSFTTGTN